MRLIKTSSLVAGDKLSEPILNENGLVLIQDGVKLTDRMIARLIKQNINYVYIQDSHVNSSEISQSSISSELKIGAMNTIRETFQDLAEKDISETSYISDATEKKLESTVKSVISEVKEHPSAITMLTDIFLTDDYTFQHSLNVAIYSIAIGVNIGLSEKELSELGMGAMLHDIGKVFIEQDILLKEGRLTEEEYNKVKEHAWLGFEYIRKRTNFSSVIAHCAYQHHERMNGSGYPRGIVASEIHPYAKIIAVADIFDAMTTNRPYRDALLPHECLELIYSGAVEQYDIQYIKAFKSSIAAYPNGLFIQLNDGRQGVVKSQNKNVCDRPIIQITEENNVGLAVENQYEVNLSQEHSLMIVKCIV